MFGTCLFAVQILTRNPSPGITVFRVYGTQLAAQRPRDSLVNRRCIVTTEKSARYALRQLVTSAQSLVLGRQIRMQTEIDSDASAKAALALSHQRIYALERELANNLW
jgi:hypothetical protein